MYADATRQVRIDLEENTKNSPEVKRRLFNQLCNFTALKIMDIMYEVLQLRSANDDWLDEEFTMDQLLNFSDFSHFMMSLENLLKQLSGHSKDVVKVLFFQLLEVNLDILFETLITIQKNLHCLLSPYWRAISFNLFSSKSKDYFFDQWCAERSCLLVKFFLLICFLDS